MFLAHCQNINTMLFNFIILCPNVYVILLWLNKHLRGEINTYIKEIIFMKKNRFTIKIFGVTILEIVSEQSSKSNNLPKLLYKLLTNKQILKTFLTAFATVMIFVCMENDYLATNIADITEVLQTLT